MSYELGIIGAGNMAEAIARGVLAASVLTPEQIIAADVYEARRVIFATQLRVRAIESISEVAYHSRVLLLSVKPQQMTEVLADLGKVMTDQTLVISIAAGISSAFIEKSLGQGKSWRVIRTMPNTPMLVGDGMVAISAGTHATPADVARARQLFEAAASVIEVPEDKIDAVTAVSGSGPAYFFFLVEQMIKAGVELGLSESDARLLAAKTAIGSAKMLMTSTDTPQELRRKVTSPGGTTHAAITHMEHAGVDKAVVAAIHAAAARSRELGK